MSIAASLEAGTPAERVAAFARVLRDNGFCFGQREVHDALRSVSERAHFSARQARRIMRLLFCSRRSELERFDELFDAFWLGRASYKRTLYRQNQGARTKRSGVEFGGGAPPGGLAQYFEWARPDETGEQASDEGSEAVLGGASGRHIDQRRDFDAVTDPEEFERLMQLAERLGARLRYRLSRRRKVQPMGAVLDMRRTYRKSIASGGMPLRLIRKARSRPPLALTVFVDVSGSMDAYSLFFMRFVHALTGATGRVEAFLFHTRLAHITGALRENQPTKMMEKMALLSQGWSGGTRIGDALAQFNRAYAKQCAGSRTIAVILSDGFDAGETDRLERELRTLKSRSHRVIWLNPMLGRASYEPRARGMQTALQHVDLFAPAHNLKSLMALEERLVRL